MYQGSEVLTAFNYGWACAEGNYCCFSWMEAMILSPSLFCGIFLGIQLSYGTPRIHSVIVLGNMKLAQNSKAPCMESSAFTAVAKPKILCTECQP